MIRQRHKKTTIWLLIAGMLHLLLIAIPGGMVMADMPQGNQSAHFQSVSLDAPACEQAPMPGLGFDLDMGQSACDGCMDDACFDRCSLCSQVQLGAPALGIPTVAAQRTTYVPVSSSRPTDPGYTPIPRPPRQLWH